MSSPLQLMYTHGKHIQYNYYSEGLCLGSIWPRIYRKFLSSDWTVSLYGTALLLHKNKSLPKAWRAAIKPIENLAEQASITGNITLIRSDIERKKGAGVAAGSKLQQQHYADFILRGAQDSKDL